jgi:endonuclease-8
MPEGPEIRRAATRLDKVLAGRVVADAFLSQPHLSDRAAALIGRRITGVTSRGKAMLTLFSDDLTLYSHNQLYGRWYVTERGRLPDTKRTLRVALHTKTHSALLYSASDIALLDPDGVASHPYLRKLGPDALDDAVHWRDIAARLRDPGFRRRSLASLYLDQAFVAGIGNYLRSEILHAAKLHPATTPQTMTTRQIGVLARTTLSVTRLAYATAGITNKPQRIKALVKQGAKRREYRFAIFAREDLSCYECGSSVRRIDVSSRRLYYCARCQPGPNHLS